jgi:hypothetical protein
MWEYEDKETREEFNMSVDENCKCKIQHKADKNIECDLYENIKNF